MKFFLIFLLQFGATFSSKLFDSYTTPTTTTRDYSGCPSGFSLLNYQTCVQVNTDKKLYTDAWDACRRFSGGNLVSIHNSIDNRILVNLAMSSGSMDAMWIGLFCPINDVRSCNWTDGSSYNYNNFVVGNPDVSVGQHVSLLQSGSSAGKWVSNQNALLGYICEVPLQSSTVTIETTTTYIRSTTTTPRSPARCRDGFTSINNNATCVKLLNTPMLFQDANLACRNISKLGNLVSVHSAQDNSDLLKIAGMHNVTRPIWLGLSCQSASASSCTWTDRPGTTEDYNNFAPGNPNVDIGTRGYMLASGNSAGKWVSSDGEFSYFSFFCAIPMSEFCQYQYNGYCYSVQTDNLNEPDARKYCQRDFGDLVSIHSQAENDFIESLVNSTGVSEYRIGAATDGVGKYWVDGSLFDYSNFAFFDPDLGKCSILATSASVVQSGQWLSNNCNSEIPFICKQLQTVPTPTPNVLGQCNGTQFLTGNGSIYSPNYPSKHYGTPIPCTYIIVAPQNSIPEIRFRDLIMDSSNLKMMLYGGIDDVGPFAILTYNDVYKYYNSYTNVLKVTFQCNPCNSDGYRYAADYRSDLL